MPPLLPADLRSSRRWQGLRAGSLLWAQDRDVGRERVAAGRGEPELLEDTQQAPEGLALEGRREGRRGQDLAFRPLREAT